MEQPWGNLVLRSTLKKYMILPISQKKIYTWFYQYRNKKKLRIHDSRKPVCESFSNISFTVQNNGENINFIFATYLFFLLVSWYREIL